MEQAFLRESLRHSRAVSRRGFLGAAAAGVVSLDRLLAQDSRQSAQSLPLAVAGYRYERVAAIMDGQVPVAGCDVSFERSKIRELNAHVFSGHGTRDVTEVGLIPYLLAYCNGGLRDYVLLPIFPLKVFRHKSIWVRSDSGIKRPEDLRGRKVATVGYSSSGLTWVRGILQDEYGVRPDELEWVNASGDSASQQTGGVSEWEKVRPEGVSIIDAPQGVDDSELLLSGEVDAIFHPAEPQAWVDRDPRIRRLFRDCREVERAYFEKTGIFPIMHTVAIRRELADAEPWLPKAVFEAYCEAKRVDYLEMRRIRWAYSSLPWYGQEYEKTRTLMGENFYSYGLVKNRKAMEAVCRYLHEQGLANRRLSVEELFEPSTRELVDEGLALANNVSAVGATKDWRHVSLEGQSNCRDVGGYRTSDGRQVRQGLVYRSGELPKLIDADVAELERRGVSQVINFLTPNEVALHGKDRVPQGTSELLLPIDTPGGLAQTILAARKKADFAEVPPDINAQIHRLLVESGKEPYAKVLREIANADKPVLFHCSHGVHRTGTATAILLGALGVPWETIREDYLLSNKYRRHEVEERLDQFRQLVAKREGVEPDAVDMTNFNAFYVLDPSYIDATRDEIQNRYGSLEGYLKRGLGLTDAELQRLRDRLLE